MKVNNKQIINILVIIFTIVIVIIFGIDRNPNNTSDKIIYLGEKENSVVYTSRFEVIKDKRYLENQFEKSKLQRIDFDGKQYALIEVKYSPCNESNIQLNEITETTKDHYRVNVTYKADCINRVCEKTKYKYYLIEVNTESGFVDVIFSYQRVNQCDNEYVEKKPIIYIYPEQEKDVIVRLKNSNLVTTSYPKYKESWNVHAYPSGKLIDNKTGKELYALYWEGKDAFYEVEDEGFIVSKEEIVPFLEEKLEILGLNAKEKEEFIIYWLPYLEQNNYNYIRFATKEEINNYMPLEISPKPDNLIRIMMTYKPLDKKIKIKDQKLEKVKRNGYTVVEWGGTLIK